MPRGPFGTNVAEPRLSRAALVVPETDVRALERDLAMISGSCRQLDDHEVVPHLLDVVDEVFGHLFPHWPSGTDVALTRYLQLYAESSDGGPWSLPPAPRDIGSAAFLAVALCVGGYCLFKHFERQFADII